MIKFPSNPADRKIGIFGGSFNPAHNGHVQLSLHAIKSLNLDEVWWLISPQNPLKPSSETATIEDRLSSAQAICQHPKIKFSILETQLGNAYTSKTIGYIKSRAPNAKFIWLMGADNLYDISKWQNWRKIFNQIPIAIFDRGQSQYATLHSKAAAVFKSSRLNQNMSQILAQQSAPAWCYIHMKKIDISSTNIRNNSI